MTSPQEKVVFVPETSAFGGGERVLLALSQYLHLRAIPHRFAWYFKTVNLAAHAGWPVQEEHLSPARKAHSKIRALNSYLQKRSRGDASSFLLVGIQAALHAGCCQARNYSLLILDTPSLLTDNTSKVLQRVAATLRSKLSRPVIRRALRRARSVMVTSDYMAREVRDLYGETPVVVRQGAPKGEFIARIPAPGAPVRLLSVCRLEPSKRVDWILTVLAALRRSGWSRGTPINCTLDIVGDGSARPQLERLADRLGVRNHTLFHGRVSDSVLESVYAGAHVFLMPAQQGYGLPALEALGRGIPVAVHRESGVSEILHGTPWVELVDGNAEHLEKSVRALIFRIQQRELINAPLPRFPSESEWASEVCGRCGWVA